MSEQWWADAMAFASKNWSSVILFVYSLDGAVGHTTTRAAERLPLIIMMTFPSRMQKLTERSLNVTAPRRHWS